jgi:site-specific DNA-methyltransferase (adenine-specific)/adenine-specific DNA-methyltransferase
MILLNKDSYIAIDNDLKGYKGKVDLIYIDPPFATGKEFKSSKTGMGYNDKVFDTSQYDNHKTKGSECIIKALSFTLKAFQVDYIKFMYPRLCLLKELLSDKGSIYVHCDWHIGHYLKIILDEIFGKENFINEIVWCYKSGGA